MSKPTSHNVSKASVELAFELSGNTLRVTFGPKNHAFWKKSLCGPLSLILTKIGTIHQTGKKTPNVVFVNDWLTDEERQIFTRYFRSTFGYPVNVRLENGETGQEFETQGVFDFPLATFP